MENLALDRIHCQMMHPIKAAQVFEKQKDVPNPRLWMDDVSGFVPVYYQGNATLVVFTDRKCWYLPWTVASTFERLAKENLTSRSLIRRSYEIEMGSYQYVPLVGGLGQIAFTPLKFRSPLIRTDGATGYFNLRDIAKYEMCSATQCILTLTSGITVDIPMTKEHGDRRIRNTRMFALSLQHRAEYPIGR